jgi:hypothetical protein
MTVKTEANTAESVWTIDLFIATPPLAATFPTDYKEFEYADEWDNTY